MVSALVLALVMPEQPLSEEMRAAAAGKAEHSGVLSCRLPAGPFVVKGDRQAEENAKGLITMMFYDMTQQYHAERLQTTAERRRADAEIGMMAAEVSRLWRRVTRPARALRRQQLRPAQRAY